MDLKAWRTTNKLTQAAAGELIGLKQPTLAKIEAGKQWPSPETIALIVAGTGGAVTANDILAHYQSAPQAEVAA